MISKKHRNLPRQRNCTFTNCWGLYWSNLAEMNTGFERPSRARLGLLNACIQHWSHMALEMVLTLPSGLISRLSSRCGKRSRITCGKMLPSWSSHIVVIIEGQDFLSSMYVSYATSSISKDGNPLKPLGKKLLLFPLVQ